MTVDPSPDLVTPSPLSSREFPSSRKIFWSVVTFALLGLVFIVFGPTVLQRAWQCIETWLPQAQGGPATRPSLSNAAQVVLYTLGGLIALVGVGLSLNRHGLELKIARDDSAKEQRRITELNSQRHLDVERELRSRFTQSVALLSDPDKPTTRQAGIYALGALADDWKAHGRDDERQVCIDVLCGYLRSHWKTTESGANDERRIRAAAFNLIAAHLRPDEVRPNWDGATFNLQGAFVDFDINFSAVTIGTSRLNLSKATFAGGQVDFSSLTMLGGGIVFNEAKFTGGDVWFSQTKFSRGDVEFLRATFSGSHVCFNRSTFSGANVIFDEATFSEGGTYPPGREDDTKSQIDFNHSTFAGGSVGFCKAKFSGAAINFRKTKFTGNYVHFDSAILARGDMIFTNAVFSDNPNMFLDLEFSGGKLYFNGAMFTEQPVEIPSSQARNFLPGFA